ncbi:MAG: hypothetical protein KBS96_00245 [Lachnospiraceae bacterium]|nr:hypothetical protein [Candidatus Colinaster scatohippi]
MKIAVVDYENHNHTDLKSELIINFSEVLGIDKLEIEIFGNKLIERPYIYGKLKEYGPDILISYNLAGFELCTLTDSVSYNLLDCKQIHWIEKKDCENEKYLNKVLSIAMFFATESASVYEYISETYDTIPALYNYSEHKGDNVIAKAVVDIIRENKIL